jgi:hypothetical protein
VRSLHAPAAAAAAGSQLARAHRMRCGLLLAVQTRSRWFGADAHRKSSCWRRTTPPPFPPRLPACSAEHGAAQPPRRRPRRARTLRVAAPPCWRVRCVASRSRRPAWLLRTLASSRPAALPLTRRRASAPRHRCARRCQAGRAWRCSHAPTARRCRPRKSMLACGRAPLAPPRRRRLQRVRALRDSLVRRGQLQRPGARLLQPRGALAGALAPGVWARSALLLAAAGAA